MTEAFAEFEAERAAGPGFGARLVALWLSQIPAPMLTAAEPRQPREPQIASGRPLESPPRDVLGFHTHPPTPNTPPSAQEQAEILALEAAEAASQFPVSADFPAQEIALKREIVALPVALPEVERGCCPGHALGKDHDPRCAVGGYGYIPKTAAAWDEEFGERAALLQFVGGYSKEYAEARATQMIGPRPLSTEPSKKDQNHGTSKEEPRRGNRNPGRRR